MDDLTGRKRYREDKVSFKKVLILQVEYLDDYFNQRWRDGKLTDLTDELRMEDKK